MQVVYKIPYRRARAWPIGFKPRARASKGILHTSMQDIFARARSCLKAAAWPIARATISYRVYKIGRRVLYFLRRARASRAKSGIQRISNITTESTFPKLRLLHQILSNLMNRDQMFCNVVRIDISIYINHLEYFFKRLTSLKTLLFYFSVQSTIA